MSATPLTPARALRKPRRIDLRAVFGIFVMLAATAAAVAFWSLSSDTRPVLVATRDLPATAILSPADLTVAHVRVADTMYQAAIPEAEMSSLLGRQLAEPVHAQQLIVRAQVAPRAPLAKGQIALTIPVTPDTAVGGRLKPGDQVQVLASLNKGKPEARTVVVLPRATVYDVGYDQRLAPLGTDSAASPPAAAKNLTLAVTLEEARQLADARWNGDLDVGLLPVEQ